MSYVYRSTNGSTVNVTSYVITPSGMSADAPIPELELMVGVCLERIMLEDVPLAETKSPEAELPAAPEPAATTAAVAEEA